MKIYHNSRCRKSREALAILHEHNLEVDIIEYLKNPITKKELIQLIKMLDINPQDLIRRQEKLFKEKYRNKILKKDDAIDVLMKYPILMQRPIIVRDNCAVLGRPPINVLDLLKNTKQNKDERRV